MLKENLDCGIAASITVFARDIDDDGGTIAPLPTRLLPPMNVSNDYQPLGRPHTPLSRGVSAPSNGLRLAAIDEHDVAAEGGVRRIDSSDLEEEKKEKEASVTWMSLPHKRQLIILTLARLSEPVVQTSLQVCPPTSHFRMPRGPLY